ncbi:flagellar basal-body rod modification protein FlgD [Cohaesibacter sp. ES.047]|uniref:flagellar hook assembly protein FlgD n=1 Tax=Cohaesibacter sp. ES.047 TaxID=1798205 RepID=UPI000BB83FC7|nr:flagellar hook capping FlgD N-terminal domain-containing protein [Cohaesibacter sp. ES.047]SNY91117.1 flagellar basal-body rod modification protein FlgD [Cohaesibacter sp. ES.047]
MTSIGSIIPQTSGSASKDADTLVQNYETFLTILTTQLQHQDPMDPMDSNQFTEQLVQFSGVEQQIRSNEQLENLANMMTSSNALGVLNFVGTTVTIDGSRAVLGEYGSASFAFDAESEGTADITITNENGQTIYSQTEVPISQGNQAFRWDGTDNAGNRMSRGTYSIKIDATDTNEDPIAIETDTTGVVENVDISSNEPMLLVGGQLIPTSQIKSVAAAVQTETE